MKAIFLHKTAMIALMACCLVAGMILPAAAQDPGIYVSPEVWVRGADVHLVDIARVIGLGSLEKQIQGVYVGSAPAPGKQRAMRGSWIKAKLERLGLPENARVDIPPRIKVGRLYQEVKDERFQELFVGFLKDNLRIGHFQISRFQTHGNGPVPEGYLEVALAESSEGRYYGQVSLRAFISVDGKTERRVSVSGWVDYESPVVVAASDLKRNTVLTSRDVRVEMQNLSRMPEGVVSEVSQVIGMRVRQGMGAGKAMLGRMLEKPPLVERGEEVTMVARSGSMVITTMGMARDSGSLGDRISVENTMSDKLVTCRVAGPDLVEVAF